MLSVVTISFNQAPYLRQCVDAVLEGKPDDAEYIVVDPGSTDGSREILKGYGKAIDRLVLEPDSGPADGLNCGFAKANGSHGYFINADDFVLPGKLKYLCEAWRENPEADILLGSAWMVDGDGGPAREMVAAPLDRGALRRQTGVLVQQGFSFRMDRFREAGGFNALNRTCWDYELAVRMIMRGAGTILLPERIGAFRLYEQSLSGGRDGQAHLERYHRDLRRIHAENGLPAPALNPFSGKLHHLLRLAETPEIALARLREMAMPSTMQRRWAADMAGAT